MQIYFDGLVQRDGVLEQRGDAFGGHTGIGLHAVDVHAFEQLLHRHPIAHAGYVAGNRAIAQRHHHLAALADKLSHFHVFLTRHGAFHERDIHAFGKLLRVDQRSVDDVGFLGYRDNALVDVEQ